MDFSEFKAILTQYIEISGQIRLHSESLSQKKGGGTERKIQWWWSVLRALNCIYKIFKGLRTCYDINIIVNNVKIMCAMISFLSYVYGKQDASKLNS